MKNLEKRKKFTDKYNRSVIDSYLRYIRIDGQISFDTICGDLLMKYLSKNIPIIVELASTYLYKKSKSTKPGKFNDAFKGEIEGHGVVVAGFSKNKFKVVDPNSKDNPYDRRGIYWVPAEKLFMSFSSLEGKSLLLFSEENTKLS